MNRIQIKMHYEQPEDHYDTLEEALDIAEKHQRQAEESGDSLDLSIHLIMDGTRQRIIRLNYSPEEREDKKEPEELEQV